MLVHVVYFFFFSNIVTRERVKSPFTVAGTI